MSYKTLRVNIRVDSVHIAELQKISKAMDRDRGELTELTLKEIGWRVIMDHEGLKLLLSCIDGGEDAI